MAYETWTYNRNHVVSSPDEMTDLQVRIIVHYGSGVDINNNVYLGGNCNLDFSDIRFTNLSGIILPYAIIYNYGTYADVMIKMDVVNQSSGFIIYWGNATATSESNWSNLFSFYDTFGTLRSEWVHSGDGSLGVYGNKLHILSDTGYTIGNIATASTDVDSPDVITGFGILPNAYNGYVASVTLKGSTDITHHGTGVAFIGITSDIINLVEYDESGNGNTILSDIDEDEPTFIELRHDGVNLHYNINNGSWNSRISTGSGNHIRIMNGPGTPTDTRVCYVYQRKYCPGISHGSWNFSLTTVSETVTISDPSTGNLVTALCNELIDITDSAIRLIHMKTMSEIVRIHDSTQGFLMHLASETVRIITDGIGAAICSEIIKLYNGGDVRAAGRDEYGIGHKRHRLNEFGHYIRNRFTITGQKIVRAIRYYTNTECEVVEQVATCEEIVYISCEVEETE